MDKELTLSKLPKTWILDIDGTLVKHNGYLLEGGDEILPGVIDFFSKIGSDDYVILLTARSGKEKENIEKLLKDNGIRFNLIVYDIPVGERILINDKKPSGLLTAFAYNKIRDSDFQLQFVIDESL